MDMSIKAMSVVSNTGIDYQTVPSYKIESDRGKIDVDIKILLHKAYKLPKVGPSKIKVTRTRKEILLHIGPGMMEPVILWSVSTAIEIPACEWEWSGERDSNVALLTWK